MAPDLHHCVGSDVPCDAVHIVFEELEAFQEKSLLLASPVPSSNYLLFLQRVKTLRRGQGTEGALGAALGLSLNCDQRRLVLSTNPAPASGEGNTAA